MPSITFHNLGNADSYRIDLDNGKKLLFDYADMRCATDPNDKRCDLPEELRKDLKKAKRDDFDVVAFTHFDEDHVWGASTFFELRHAAKYQGDGRIKITELWVPAWAITESRADLCDDGKALQAEARYRLRQGTGIRVFSRPAALKNWLESQGLTVDQRAHLISDAGTCVPGFTKASDGVEFFVHSPFASRQDDETLVDRNSNSLVFQAVFSVDGRESKALLMADTEYSCMQEIVNITKYHRRNERLEWDIVKLPHHCSYGSLGPDKGKDETTPVEEVKWLYESQGRYRARIVSTSKPIPSNDDDIQPPHRQAANYYKRILGDKSGKFLVTMEHPSTSAPEPLVIEIDGFGFSIRQTASATGVSALTRPAPRAG